MYKIAIYKDVKYQLDINVLKEINSNQLYDLGQAQTISKEIRKKGGVSWIYENKYDKVNISYQESEHKVFNFIENKENYSKTILKGLIHLFIIVLKLKTIYYISNQILNSFILIN